MNSRLVYISNKVRCLSLQKRYGLSDQSIRNKDYLFVLKKVTASQNDELRQIETTYFPLFQIIKEDKESLIVKIIPEQSLFEAVQTVHIKDASVRLFISRLVNYFTDRGEKCWDYGHLKIGFEKKPLVMGILNVTPDSFFDGGKFIGKDQAVEHALEMIEEGADLIDIGGESTRPGAVAVSASEEMKRVLPVIEGIKKHSDCLISIDTYKSLVAKEAIEAGAHIINDISGTVFDEKMLGVIDQYKCPVIIMHIKGTPKNMQVNPVYSDVNEEVYNFFNKKCEEICSLNGGKIVIDPGIGFGKSVTHNLQLLRDIGDFTFLDKPILVGVSRKSFIGKILHVEENNRLLGSLSSGVYAFLNGADILRVHDVKATVEARSIINNILAS